MPMKFEDDDNQPQAHQIAPIAPSASSIAKQDSAKPVSTRKSGSNRKDKPARAGIASQAQAVDQRIQSTRSAIGEIRAFVEYQSVETAEEFAQVLKEAPDRFFELVNEKVGEVEIDGSQFEEFNQSIRDLVAGMKNARTQTQPS